MSTVKTINILHPSGSVNNIVNDASGNITVGGNLTASSGTMVMGSSFLRNRIINGDMRIDQRNSGSSVTASATTTVTYTLDRYFYYVTQASKFTVQQNAASVTPPSGFKNYLGVTSSSAYSVGTTDQFVIGQRIEGFNIADLNWGSASALAVTLSFWVRSSLTGTFGGAINNSSYARTYPFSYTISSANTWEYKTVTIAGDTTGTWESGNLTGLALTFGLGCGSSASGTAGSWGTSGAVSATGATSVVGTNGATWYVTGVQLEVGSVATPFERRLYGQELALCQRYFQKSYNQSLKVGYSATDAGFANGSYGAPGELLFNSYLADVKNGYSYFTPMRTSPTHTFYSSQTGTSGKAWRYGTGDVSIGTGRVGETCYSVETNFGVSNNTFGFMWTASAEL